MKGKHATAMSRMPQFASQTVARGLRPIQNAKSPLTCKHAADIFTFCARLIAYAHYLFLCRKVGTSMLLVSTLLFQEGTLDSIAV